MSKRKKIILALSSIGTIVVALLISVVTVFAAIMTTVNNKFTISYTALAVNANVSVSVKAENYDNTAGSVENYTQLYVSEQQTKQQLSSEKIQHLLVRLLKKLKVETLQEKMANWCLTNFML